MGPGRPAVGHRLGPWLLESSRARARGVQKQIIADEGMTGHDNRINTTYLGGGVAGGLNTGLRALELVDKSRFVPTDVEIGKSIEDAIERRPSRTSSRSSRSPAAVAAASCFTPFRRFGGSAAAASAACGGGGGGLPEFNPMRASPPRRAPFANDDPVHQHVQPTDPPRGHPA